MVQLLLIRQNRRSRCDYEQGFGASGCLSARLGAAVSQLTTLDTWLTLSGAQFPHLEVELGKWVKYVKLLERRLARSRW